MIVDFSLSLLLLSLLLFIMIIIVYLSLFVEGMAALSLLTSGKYVIDPEQRGAEFERITQNLDLQFWKSFWNLTESGLITVGGARSRPIRTPRSAHVMMGLPDHQIDYCRL